MAGGLEAAAARGRVTVVRAAGGLVRRTGPVGTEVLLVHRPAYDDWTFPKGKAEETGLRCALEDDAGATDYIDARGRPKQVRWWLMRALDDEAFEPNDEVDELRWAGLDDAAQLLTYERDAELLARVR